MSYYLELALAEEDDELRHKLLLQHQKITVQQQIIGCRNCPLYKTSRRRVPFHGDRAPMLILGEAPGENEDLKGIPFCGKSGKLLRGELEVNLLRDKLAPAIANTCCCRPPNNRTPKEEEVNACRGNLYSQIDYLDPWLILCVGRTPLQALRPDLRVTRDRGHFFDIPNFPGRWGFATFHPSYVLQNPTLKPTFRADIRVAATALKMRVHFGAEIIDSQMARMRGKFPSAKPEEREFKVGIEFIQQALCLPVDPSPADFSGLYGEQA